jgi:hypothetical protein
VTAFAIIIACIALLFAVYAVRGNPGRAVADTAILVILIGAITLVDLVLGQFMDTRDFGTTLAMLFAGAFALDALYGLMAPERQRARDKKLRRLMKRRA